MASQTPAELRQAQGTQFNQLLHDLAEYQATAKAMIKKREAGRALIISLTEKAVERFEMPENVSAKLNDYKPAFDQTISLARAHELIMDEMEDKAEEEWKKVRKGSMEKRVEVLENWTKEHAKVKKAYEEEVVRVYTDAGLQSDGSQ